MKKTCLGGRAMSIARQDAWNQDEDLLLVEVVLRHIREGSTQLKAFEEVGKQLSRTSAACGFRWNSFVRKQYISGIELAKKQRKDHKREGMSPIMTQDKLENKHVNTQAERCKETEAMSPLTLEEVIGYLREKERIARLDQQEKQRHAAEVGQVQRENKRLREEIKSLQTKLVTVEEDYRALLQIVERARKLIVYEEDKTNSKVKFQMDKNGNLERVHK